MRGIEFCYYHRRVHEGPRLLFPTLAMLEDAHGVQAALMEVLCAFLENSIDHRAAALLLYGLQTASANLKRVEQLDPEQVVTEEAPRERMPDGVFEPRNRWTPEERKAIDDLIFQLEMKRARGETKGFERI